MSISWCKSAYTCTTSESGGYPCTGLAESCLNPFIHKKLVIYIKVCSDWSRTLAVDHRAA